VLNNLKLLERFENIRKSGSNREQGSKIKRMTRNLKMRNVETKATRLIMFN
jgi:hypothetical protein